MNKKGVVLLMVLGTVLVVVILANVIIAIISSQSRLTHHQVSRIQAYYAAQAGMNYALERLRRPNDWTPNDCNSGCNLPNDPNFPTAVIQPVTITILPANTNNCPSPPAPPGGACVSVTATYTGPAS